MRAQALALVMPNRQTSDDDKKPPWAPLHPVPKKIPMARYLLNTVDVCQDSALNLFGSTSVELAEADRHLSWTRVEMVTSARQRVNR